MPFQNQIQNSKSFSKNVVTVKMQYIIFFNFLKTKVQETVKILSISLANDIIIAYLWRTLEK